MKTPEELAKSALAEMCCDEFTHEKNPSDVRAIARAIRLGQVEAWREAAKQAETTFPKNCDGAFSLGFSEGVTKVARRHRAKADAIEREGK